MLRAMGVTMIFKIESLIRKKREREGASERGVVSGFLVCLMIVLMVTMSSFRSARQGYEEAIRSGDEEILRVNLSNLRDAIREYSSQKGVAPNELNDLVESGYINMIPADPMTGKANWVVVRYQCLPQSKCTNGIKDVRSSSSAKSSKGNAYSEW